MNFKVLTLPLLVIVNLEFGLCAPGGASFIIAPIEKFVHNIEKRDVGGQIPIIYEMNVKSDVSNRFAKTVIESKVRNAATEAKAATFSVILPEQAFISEFVMVIDGKSYKAYVKGKEEAKNIYDKAVSSGQSAAHVAVSARDSNRFTVSVNVEAEKKVTFLLTYEELLERRNNQYELVLNINPGQIVKDLNVEVYINESRPLVFIKTPALRTGNELGKNDDKLNPSSVIERINPASAKIKFQPNTEKQKEYAKELGGNELLGVSGQFVVQYEVERDPTGGEILLKDGYFVHFFAPSDAQSLPKNVFFILDTSGSMSGIKIQELKDAMVSILKEIKPEDTISIVEFNSQTFVYNIQSETSTIVKFNNYTHPFEELSKNDLPGPYEATPETIEKAKKLVTNLKAGGGTYMIGGLETGLYLVKSEIERRKGTEKKRQPIIVFLTDGEPNVGMYSTDEITSVVTGLNGEGINVPIFSLSFGEGADKAFLRRLSLKNSGFSRHIYEAADASIQLQDFYRIISSPLFTNIHFKYDSEAEEITKTDYPIYFKGNEFVVAGLYKNKELDAKVNLIGANGPIVLKPTVIQPVGSLEKLWAYLTIKQTLQKREVAQNKTELTKKALDLALKYSFVTEVSSLVVVKPNGTSAVDTEEASGSTVSGFINRGANFRPAHHMRPVTGLAATSPRVHLGGPSISYNNFISTTDLKTHAVALPGTIMTIHKPGIPHQQTLERSLPWLSTALNPNGTLSLPGGVYLLGDPSLNLPSDGICPKTPKGEEGFCSLIKDCPAVFSFLTDFEVYKKFSCPVQNKFAGVCCPKTTVV